MKNHFWTPVMLLMVLMPLTASSSETTTYTYDALGQLISTNVVGESSSGVATTYRYDQAGNRENVTVAGVPVSVVDASFEEPNQNGGFQYNPVVAGATFTGGSGVAANGSAWGFANAPSGTQVAFLQSGSVRAEIVLNIAGLTPGQRYVVAFKMAQRPGFSTDGLVVTAQNTALGTYTPQSGAFQDVTTAVFTANNSVGTLIFTKNPNSGDTSLAIDAVTIVPAS